MVLRQNAALGTDMRSTDSGIELACHDLDALFGSLETEHPNYSVTFKLVEWMQPASWSPQELTRWLPVEHHLALPLRQWETKRQLKQRSATYLM